MADNFYSFVNDEAARTARKYKVLTEDDRVYLESAVQDEAIIKPWTHRFTVYCSNPSKEFMGLLKSDESVVAVYEKEKNAVKA